MSDKLSHSQFLAIDHITQYAIRTLIWIHTKIQRKKALMKSLMIY